LPIRIYFADGEIMNLEAGVVPEDYSLALAGVDLTTPMHLEVHGIAQGNHYVASIGAVDEWTFLVYETTDGETVTEVFYGTWENVAYSEIVDAWRLPGSWSQDQANDFTP
jgi:hypothetical protein